MKKLVLFLVSFTAWLLLTWTIYYPALLIGILISIIIGFWFGDLFTQRPRHFFQIKRLLYSSDIIGISGRQGVAR